MVKRKTGLQVSITPEKAMAIVARYNRLERREFRLRIGRITNLSKLDEEEANFFFGECMVFSQISEEVNEWIQTHFVKKGGTPTNFFCLRDLFEFYQALTSDVDIRYDLMLLENGDYDITNTSIVGNDFYVPKM